MSRICLNLADILLVSFLTAAHAAPARTQQKAVEDLPKSVEILSSTDEADLRPYLRGVIKLIRVKWYVSAAGGLSEPLKASRAVAVELAIEKGGAITDINVVQSSGDQFLDQAAVRGLRSSSPLRALPPGFTGDSLRVRLHFLYLPGTSGAPPSESESVKTNSVAGEGDDKFVPYEAKGLSPEGLVYRVVALEKKIPPRIIHQTEPTYTERARGKKIQGSVVISFIVTTTGDVMEPKVTAGLDDDLDKQALAAVRTWKFQPATKDGKAIPWPVTVSVTFKLY
jgi:TonB family protein